MKLSARDREQAVLLLRCAADLKTRNYVYAYTVALEKLATNYRARAEAHRAFARAYEHRLDGPYDYHATLLEAAQILDDD